MKFIPILFALGGAWLPLHAATLYSQLGTINNAWYSDASLPSPQALGDTFQATASWSVKSIGWRGVYTDNALPADAFAVNVWATGGNGLPTFTLTLDPGAVTRTSTGTQTSWGWNIYEYSLTLNQPLLLNPGNYVLEVQDNTPRFHRQLGLAYGGRSTLSLPPGRHLVCGRFRRSAVLDPG